MFTLKQARDAIRATWGRPQFKHSQSGVLVFLLGSSSDQTIQAQIRDENIENSDIVQGNFLDTYHNLSYKNIMGKLWVTEFCPQTKFVVKTDDDCYVDLYSTLTIASAYLDTEVNYSIYQ